MNYTLKQKISISLRRTVYFILGNIDQKLLKKQLPHIILCYHSVNEDNWRFSESISEFKKQIEYLQTRYKFITPHDLVDHVTGVKKLTESSVLLTFDDGYQNLLSIKNYLKEKGIKPLFFILSQPYNANRQELHNDLPLLSESEVQELAKEGWTIGCHSATHADFYNLSDNQILREVINSKTEIESIYKTNVDYFAYPKGAYNDKILNAVKQAGYKLCFSMNSDFLTEKTDQRFLPRTGVDRTHEFTEFKNMITVSSVIMRKLLMKTFLGKLI